MIRVGEGFFRARAAADNLTGPQREAIAYAADSWFRARGEFVNVNTVTANALIDRDLLARVSDERRPRAKLYQPTALGLLVALVLKRENPDGE